MPSQEILLTVPGEPDAIQFTDEEAAWSYMGQKFNEPFELYDKLLWRYEVIEINANKYYVVMTFHHVIIDGFSFALFIKLLIDRIKHIEEEENYSTSGDSVSNSSDDHDQSRYIEFVKEDEAYASSKSIEADRQFWCERLLTRPPSLFSLPEVLRPEQRLSDVSHWALNRSSYVRANAFAAERGGTFFHVLLALVGLYFSRTRDSNDVVIGIPILNRNSAEQRRTVGMFVSVIPLIISIDEQQTFGELVRSIAKDLQDCYDHQRLSVTEISQLVKTEHLSQRLSLIHI